MITSIMLYNESGLLVYDMRFTRCEINSELVAAFVHAINQFGFQLFPDNVLCDIVFTNTHLFIEPRDVGGRKVTFLVIHDVFDDQKEVLRIVDALHAEVDKKHAMHVNEVPVAPSKLAPLTEFLVQLLRKLKRKETPYACSIDP
ncbi:MAG: hypothetical protein JW839_07605 [Candidatus Lokiarchaeota archaeon]|nr:hypothetical protein [Candidatus Lokiarchaeota archaeon]